MKDSQVYVYFCKSCEEEITSWGEKQHCPYCKAKKPKFDLLQDISESGKSRSNSKTNWFKKKLTR